VLSYVRKHELIRAGDRIGIAVSAGADSVGLLRLLLELRSELGIVLTVVHLNHELRGEESEGDEQFVRSLARSHGLPFLGEALDVRAHAAENGESIETAARKLRYDFFAKALEPGGLDKIATGHTLDDQAETVVFKLTRGAGTRGLAGIYPRLVIPHSLPARARPVIIRPLLSTPKTAIGVYLSEIGQSWREDSTNRDLSHRRNRIRHEVLPRLEQVNPSVRKTLAEAAEIARAEEEFWSEQVARCLPQVWQGAPSPVLSSRKLEEFAPAMRRRLVRAAGESLGLNLEFRQVEAVVELCSHAARVVLPDGWVAVGHKSGVKFERGFETHGDYEYELPMPGRVTISEADVVIEAVPLVSDDDQHYGSEHLLDFGFARGLRIRNWRPGERFWPSHSKRARRIKELLGERRIVGEEKKRWPVVSCGTEIVWLRGFGVRRDFQAKGGKGVLIRELPLSARVMENPHSEAIG
jgi:tRNA(Ile)-lysidine synthase